MKLSFSLLLFLAQLPLAQAFFLENFFSFLCSMSGGRLFCFGDNDGDDSDDSKTISPTTIPVTPSRTMSPTSVPVTPSPTTSSMNVPVTPSPTISTTGTPVTPSGQEPFPLRIRQDNFGVAAIFKEKLDPFIPVELVSSNVEFHIGFDLTEGSSSSIDLPFSANAFCEPGGYVLKSEIDPNDKAIFDATVRTFFTIMFEDWGLSKDSACDAGYWYSSDVSEISCCTAPQLSKIDKCFKGRNDSSAACWSPPDVTPQPGQKIVKVKVIAASSLIAQGWTEEDTLKKLERANRLLASSNGLTNQLRFTLYAQEIVDDANFGLNADDQTLDNVSAYGSNDQEKSEYNVIMYLFKEKPSGAGAVVGKAVKYLCGGNPSPVAANVYASLTVPHELMHTLGAEHDPNGCNDYIIGIDSGMGACNVDIMQNKIPSYTCLQTA